MLKRSSQNWNTSNIKSNNGEKNTSKNTPFGFFWFLPAFIPAKTNMEPENPTVENPLILGSFWTSVLVSVYIIKSSIEDWPIVRFGRVHLQSLFGWLCNCWQIVNVRGNGNPMYSSYITMDTYKVDPSQLKDWFFAPFARGSSTYPPFTSIINNSIGAGPLVFNKCPNQDRSTALPP